MTSTWHIFTMLFIVTSAILSISTGSNLAFGDACADAKAILDNCLSIIDSCNNQYLFSSPDSASQCINNAGCESQKMDEIQSEVTYQCIKSISSESQNQTEKDPKSSFQGGCLIATATFGSELAPQVQQLRELRDNYLLKTESGTLFLTGFNELYYSFSPTIADWERQNPPFKEVVKIGITPLLTSLSILNYVDMDSEEEVLVYGISLILLNVGMYVVAPAGIGLVLARKK
ncbi:MAG: CFI-box-CTERM domain-containing protein [Nitrosopumilaceae archaeon]